MPSQKHDNSVTDQAEACDNDFAARLKRELGDRTAYWLAKQIKVSTSTVEKWLKRQTEPNLSNLIAVSEALHVSVEWLATGGLKNRLNDVYLQSPDFTERLRMMRISYDQQALFFDRIKMEPNQYMQMEADGVVPGIRFMSKIADIGFSLDYLLTGEGNFWRDKQDSSLRSGRYSTIPEQLVVDAVAAVEDWLVAHNRVLPPEKKGQVIAILLEEAMDQGGEQPVIDRAAAGRLLRVAG